MAVTEERLAADLFGAARRAMIDSQLRPSGVNEPWVLAAMASIPRENYVPENARAAAYTDRAVPLGQGRHLAAPLFYGLMLQEAAPSREDNALLIGDGNGYLAALLRPRVGSLDAIEPSRVKGRRGKYSYSLIVIDGAAEDLPDAIAAQLAEGGRLVTGLVERGITRLAAGRKAGGVLGLLPVIEIGIPQISEFAAAKRWSF